MAGFDDPAFYGGSWAAVYERACLRLRERYGGWDRRPFTSARDGHVSVYQLVSAPERQEVPDGR